MSKVAKEKSLKFFFFFFLSCYFHFFFLKSDGIHMYHITSLLFSVLKNLSDAYMQRH